MEQWAVITLVVISVNYSVLLHNVGTPGFIPGGNIY